MGFLNGRKSYGDPYEQQEYGGDGQPWIEERAKPMSTVTYATFEVEVDSPPVAEQGRRGVNMTADCRAQASGVVRIPATEYVGMRSSPNRGKFLVRAKLHDVWLSRSNQEVVRRAAAARHLELASEYLK